MNTQAAIFVSIASYRDAELLPTLHDMLEKASGLFSLSITVCWQDEGDISQFERAGFRLCDRKKSGEHDLFIFDYQGSCLQVIRVHYFLSEGACWARNLCETRYQQQDYCLQIDSHCRFIKKWDVEMVSLLQQLKSQSKKPVLSSYPPAYEPGKEEEKANYVSRLVLRGFSQEKILQLTSVDFESDVAVRGCYLAGGFIFAEGQFLRDVPNDPLIFFEGEEISMSVRAFSHGYDVWHPHTILLWHFYGRKDHARIWTDHNSEAKEAGSVSRGWWERDGVSKKRVKILLGLEKDGADLGRWGLGDRRSLDEFEFAAGVSFQQCLALPEVMGKDRKAWFPGPPQKNWQHRLTLTSNKTVIITRRELGCALQELDWLHVGIYSSNNDLLQKKTLSQVEIDRAFSLTGGEEINVIFNFTLASALQPCVLGLYARLSKERADDHVEQGWWMQTHGAGPEKAFSRLNFRLKQQCHEHVHALHRYVMTDLLLCWLWESGIVQSLQSLSATTSLSLDTVLLADYSEGSTRHGAWANWLGTKLQLLPGLSRTMTMPPLPAFRVRSDLPAAVAMPLPVAPALPAPLSIPLPAPTPAPAPAPFPLKHRWSLRWVTTVVIGLFAVAIALTSVLVSQYREIRNKTGTAREENFFSHQTGGTVTLFTQGSAELGPDKDNALSTLLPLVMSRQGRFLIVGHSDNTGTDRLNQIISEKRAEAVRDWLVNHTGIPPSRFIIKGEGDSHPVASNDTAEGRRQNRRVELLPLIDNHAIETSKGL